MDNTRADTAPEFPYPWFEMVCDISTDMKQSDHILFGESSGDSTDFINAWVYSDRTPDISKAGLYWEDCQKD